MNKKGLYPWQNETWKRLIADKARLPHALLLRGRPGIGKLDFAVSLAKSLLCAAPQTGGFFCDQCASCSWFEQNNHPDYRFLMPEQESSADEDVPAKKTTKKSQI